MILLENFKIGHQSEVAKYLVSSGQVKHEQVNESGHYAELWVGTHVKTPCMLDTSDQENKMKQYKPMNYSFT